MKRRLLELGHVHSGNNNAISKLHYLAHHIQHLSHKMIRPVKETEVELRPSSMVGAGTGLFAKKKIKAGTMMRYITVLYKTHEIGDKQDETYFMSVSYVEDGISKSARGIVGDGNPSMSPMCKMKKVDTVASYINEASIMPPNCIFVQNDNLTKADVKRCHKEHKPITIAYIIVPVDIEKGKELFTMYGSSYSRGYKTWRDRNGHKDNLVGISQEMVDGESKYIHDMFIN